MKPYRLVIFDFDGTLADSFAWAMEAVNRIAGVYGFRQIAPREVEALRGLEPLDIMQHLGVHRWKVPLIARALRRLMADEVERISLFPGVPRMIRGLADEGVILAVVSSNAEQNVRAVLGDESAGRIAHYGCGASLFGKASKFRRIARAVGAPPDEAICVGDEVRDLEAARRAGLRAGAVAWGYTDPMTLGAHVPDEWFATIEEMTERLARRPRIRRNGRGT